MIEFACHNCNRTLKAPLGTEGRLSRCKCGAGVVVPMIPVATLLPDQSPVTFTLVSPTRRFYWPKPTRSVIVGGIATCCLIALIGSAVVLVLKVDPKQEENNAVMTKEAGNVKEEIAPLPPKKSVPPKVKNVSRRDFIDAVGLFPDQVIERFGKPSRTSQGQVLTMYYDNFTVDEITGKIDRTSVITFSPTGGVAARVANFP